MSKSAFKIPLQTEVATYMGQKKGWPPAFCDYYAEKFWNHYQASGWKLSNGNTMKDWMAAFNANWQTLKFKEDIDKLNTIQSQWNASVFAEKVKQGDVGDEWHQLDLELEKYKKHPTYMPFDSFGKWYPLIANAKLLRKISPEEREELLKIYEGDIEKCKCAAVKMTFDSYAMTGLTFSHLIKLRNQLNGSGGGN